MPAVLSVRKYVQTTVHCQYSLLYCAVPVGKANRVCVNFSLQKKEAERPKVEVVQEEEEVVHEDNEWGEQLTVLNLYQFAWI